jgi:hypothetical protein
MYGIATDITVLSKYVTIHVKPKTARTVWRAFQWNFARIKTYPLFDYGSTPVGSLRRRSSVLRVGALIRRKSGIPEIR